jgi:hypothetical protein
VIDYDNLDLVTAEEWISFRPPPKDTIGTEVAPAAG